ncbi:MAG: hypothetical protein ACLGH4_10165 [Actinomycetes bacterium]
MTIEITYNDTLIEEIAARFDLRDPNKRALQAVVRAVESAGGAVRAAFTDAGFGAPSLFTAVPAAGAHRIAG